MKTILLMILLSASAHAGVKEIGNGGQGVYCPKTNSVRIFDYYEAEILRGLILAKSPHFKNYEDKVKWLIARLEVIDPVRAKLYQDRFADFLQESRFVVNSTLEPIPDANSFITPKGCSVVQLAIQHPPEFPGEAYYFIDQDKWKLMDVDSKAGLVLHEIIYREAIAAGADTSEGARYLNATIAGSDFPSITMKEYFQILADVKIRAYTLFHDPDSGKIIFETNESGPRDLAHLNQICAETIPGSSLATEADLKSYYPVLGSIVVDFVLAYAPQARNPLINASVLDENGQPEYVKLQSDQIVIESNNQGFPPICQWQETSLQ